MHLYFLYKRIGERFTCEVYLLIINNKRLNDVRAVFLYKLFIQPIFANTKWSINPYEKMVFFFFC